jgi:signal transduction histidine kinase
VSEFRALRASVLALWQKAVGISTDPLALEDNIRFNEGIDRALAESVKSYAANVASSRDMFLAILGHDLRGPLATIGMSAHVLVAADLGEAARQQAAARVQRASLQMGRLITDLLEFTQSRLGGGIPIRRADCDLAWLCSEVVESVRASHPEQALTFQACGDLNVQADADRLQQVLSNLLYNAVQHGDPQAEVSLLARGTSEGVTLAVRNRGRPIPPHAMPYIFEPLVRANAGTAAPGEDRSRTSLGLGLFIVREIVRGHGGSIAVASDRQAGTVFTLCLPRRATPPG